MGFKTIIVIFIVSQNLVYGDVEGSIATDIEESIPTLYLQQGNNTLWNNPLVCEHLHDFYLVRCDFKDQPKMKIIVNNVLDIWSETDTLTLVNAHHLVIQHTCVPEIKVYNTSFVETADAPVDGDGNCRQELKIFNSTVALESGMKDIYISDSTVEYISGRDYRDLSIINSKIDAIENLNWLGRRGWIKNCKIQIMKNVTINHDLEIRGSTIDGMEYVYVKGGLLTFSNSAVSIGYKGLWAYYGEIHFNDCVFPHIDNSAVHIFYDTKIFLINANIKKFVCKGSFRIEKGSKVIVNNLTSPMNLNECLNDMHYSSLPYYRPTLDGKQCFINGWENMEDHPPHHVVNDEPLTLQCLFNGTSDISSQFQFLFDADYFMDQIPPLAKVQLLNGPSSFSIGEACGLEVSIRNFQGGLQRWENDTTRCKKDGFKSTLTISESDLDYGIHMEYLKNLTIYESSLGNVNLTYPLEYINISKSEIHLLGPLTVGPNASVATFQDLQIHVLDNVTIQSPLDWKDVQITKINRLVIDIKDKELNLFHMSPSSLHVVAANGIVIKSGTLVVSEKMFGKLTIPSSVFGVLGGDITFYMEEEGKLKIISDASMENRHSDSYSRRRIVSAYEYSQVTAVNFPPKFNLKRSIKLRVRPYKEDGYFVVPSHTTCIRPNIYAKLFKFKYTESICDFTHVYNASVVLKPNQHSKVMTRDASDKKYTIIGAETLLLTPFCVNKLILKKCNNIRTRYDPENKDKECNLWLNLYDSKAIEITEFVYNLSANNSDIRHLSSDGVLERLNITYSNISNIVDFKFNGSALFSGCNIHQITGMRSPSAWKMLNTYIHHIKFEGIIIEDNVLMMDTEIQLIEEHGIKITSGRLVMQNVVINELKYEGIRISDGGKLVFENVTIHRAYENEEYFDVLLREEKLEIIHPPKRSNGPFFGIIKDSDPTLYITNPLEDERESYSSDDFGSIDYEDETSTEDASTTERSIASKIPNSTTKGPTTTTKGPATTSNSPTITTKSVKLLTSYEDSILNNPQDYLNSSKESWDAEEHVISESTTTKSFHIPKWMDPFIEVVMVLAIVFLCIGVWFIFYKGKEESSTTIQYNAFEDSVSIVKTDAVDIKTPNVETAAGASV